MIEPTVGRIVWYIPRGHSDAMLRGAGREEEPLAAIITHVLNDTHVNLCVFAHCGSQNSRWDVLLVQDEADRPAAGSYCEWMPYQKGHALKTEALEQELKARGPVAE